jgi:putative ABC transport system permease protein
MSAFGSGMRMRGGAWLPLRIAWREMRGGLHGFYIFVACVALGVMAIAGIGALSGSLAGGIAREGRFILGGDVAFSLIHREAKSEERAFLQANGDVSTVASLRTMARSGDGRTALVEAKAVDSAYPLYGAVVTDPPAPLATLLAQRDDAYGAIADPALMARLDLKPGARVAIGQATFVITAMLDKEPDKLAGGIGFGPRLLISIEALRATQLLQPGSLVRWRYRVRLAESTADDRAARAFVTSARVRFPEAGWGIRTRQNASPQLSRNIERFTQFLTMVGLTALLVGGVGVANAVKSHLDRRRDVIATLKALGATGGRVFSIYLTQVLLLALIGAVPGLVLGAALPFLMQWAFGAIIPLPLEPSLQAGNLALALVYGLLTALAFALWPLGRAHDVPVSALFRDEIMNDRRRPRFVYVVATASVIAVLVVLAITLSYDSRIAVIFVAAATGVFIALRLVATGLMAIARRLPRPRSTAWRMAIANIHRPGALTPTIVLSLGLGLALLVTLIQIDGNLRQQFLAALPENSPAFYFVDIQSSDRERFDQFVAQRAPDALVQGAPMLRGRIVSANGIAADRIKAAPNATWVLQSDRGITYSDMVPDGSRVVDGDWWPRDYAGAPLVSFEKRIADGLGLKLGDPVTVNVLGRNITARIANLRLVDWESLAINFVMVFSPNTFAGAPHANIATLAYRNGSSSSQEIALLKAVAAEFPAITIVRVREALDSIGGLITNLALALRGASSLTLVAAMLVLGGALAAGHRHRVYDAVILKTLGATRRRLLAAYGLEYLLLGSATALFGVAVGSVAAWLLMTEVMTLTFTWLPLPALAAAFGALVVTVVLGLLGTASALRRKPAVILRNL